MRYLLSLLVVTGLHAGFWLLFTARMAPRMPEPERTVMVQLIAAPAKAPSERSPARVLTTAMASAVAPASVSPLSLPPAQPVVDIREILPDDLPNDLVVAVGYRDAQQVDQRARALTDLSPSYPLQAFKQREHGRVLVEILINAQGGIDGLRLIAATAGFATSAMAALDSMHFDPAMLGGQPVASRLLVELIYRLNENMAAVSLR